MKNGDKDGSGFEEFVRKRNSKKSTVGIVETTDPMRLMEYLQRLRDFAVESAKEVFLHKLDPERHELHKAPVEFYVVDIFRGIVKHNINVEGETEEDLNIKMEEVVHGGGPEYEPSTIMEFEESLPIVAKMLKRSGDVDTPGYRTIVMIHGIINDQRTLNMLEIFVNDVSIDTDVMKSRSLVCIATPDCDLLPKSVVSNGYVIRPKPSTADERRRSLQTILDYYQRVLSARGVKRSPALTDCPPENIVDVTAGLNINETESTLMESMIKNELECIRFTDIVRAKIEVVKALRGVSIDMLDDAKGFEAVGGYEPIKGYLNRKVIQVYLNPELAKQMGVTTPRGILLFGPPGTGKTHLSRQMAKTLNCVFLEVNFDALMSKWVGESESNLRELLARIDAMGPRVLVLFDELDSIGSRGGADSGNHVHDSMFGTLLKWLSNPKRQAIVVGTTNVPQKLDKALVRDQRFDNQIFMGLPDKAARIQILEIKLKETGCLIAKDICLEEIARKTEWWSGANIEGLVKEALYYAFERILDAGKTARTHTITRADVDRAFTTKDKNISDAQRDNDTYLEYANLNCDDKSLIVTVVDGDSNTGKRPLKLLKNARFSDAEVV